MRPITLSDLRSAAETLAVHPAYNAVGEAIKGWIAAGCSEPLEAALGLAGAGRSPQLSAKVHQRDVILRAGAERYLGNVPTTAEKAQRMSDGFSRYFNVGWKLDRAKVENPHPASLRGVYWAALKCLDRLIGVHSFKKILGNN